MKRIEGGDVYATQRGRETFTAEMEACLFDSTEGAALWSICMENVGLPGDATYALYQGDDQAASGVPFAGWDAEFDCDDPSIAVYFGARPPIAQPYEEPEEDD